MKQNSVYNPYTGARVLYYAVAQTKDHDACFVRAEENVEGKFTFTLTQSVKFEDKFMDKAHITLPADIISILMPILQDVERIFTKYGE